MRPRSFWKSGLVRVALIPFLLASSRATAAPFFSLLDLGTLGGVNSQATGINNAGQVVGFSDRTGTFPQHAFRTAPNSPITPASDLGTLGGLTSQATGINDAAAR
jgi:probable HAF family extracellular repeat protein